MLETNFDQQLEDSLNDPPEEITVKDLEINSDGIRIKYNKFHQGRITEGYYPKRGEVSNNYTDRINDNCLAIALGVLAPCGLTEETWKNADLKLNKVSFGIEAVDGRKEYYISGKITSKNELLEKQQTFPVPRLSHDVLAEGQLVQVIKELIDDLKDFYNGKKKIIQPSLFD